MVDSARQLLDELMGRNRNLDPLSVKGHRLNWEDSEVRNFFFVFVNIYPAASINRSCSIVLSILFGEILSARSFCEYTSRFGLVFKVA